MSFAGLVAASQKVHDKIFRPKSNEARDKLKRVEMYLFLQVSGDYADYPIIEGGYRGLNYHNALGIISSCIVLIEVEENFKAIKEGKPQPYSFGYRQ